MTDRTDAFRLEEYRALRAEIDHHLKAVVTIETLLFAGIGAIYAFEGDTRIRWAMPVLVVIAGMGALPHYIRTQNIGDYLRCVECEFLGNGGGWEHFLKGKAAPSWQRWPFVLLIGLSWGALLVGSVALAWFSETRT